MAHFFRDWLVLSAQRAPSSAGRLQWILLQATNWRMIAPLRAENPRLRILMYQDVTFSKPSDPSGMTTCTRFPADRAGHPGWFLKTASGADVLARGKPDNHVMDVGNPGYIHACVTHAIALAKRLGFNGVQLDDVTSWIGLSSATTPARYPTPRRWQAAMSSLVTHAGPAMHAAGLKVIANIGAATPKNGVWQRWSTPLDGAEEESWTDGGEGRLQQLPYWRAKLADAAWSEAHGKYAFLHSYDTTERGNTYGLASMLLIAGGHSSYGTANATYISHDTWYPEYDTARRLGLPAGPFTVLSNGVYKRRFAHGIVLVNPTAHATGSFSIGAGAYSGSRLRDVSSVAMGPASGLILLRVS